MKKHHQVADGILGLKPCFRYDLWKDEKRLFLIAEETLPRQCPRIPAEETIKKLAAMYFYAIAGWA